MKTMTSLGRFLAPLLFATAALAQQPAAPASSKPALPKGKIAVVDSAVFQDQLDEFKERIEALNRLLEPRSKELQALAQKIVAQEDQLQRQRNILTVNRVAEMEESLDAMKRDYSRRTTDLRDFAKREQSKAFEPVLTKLGKFASEYSMKHDITFMIDLGNAVQSRALLWHDERIDVTKDFVAEYNKAYPVSAPAQK